MADYFKISEGYLNFLQLVQEVEIEVDKFLHDSHRRKSGIVLRDKLFELKKNSMELRNRLNKHQMLIKSEYE